MWIRLNLRGCLPFRSPENRREALEVYANKGPCAGLHNDSEGPWRAEISA